MNEDKKKYSVIGTVTIGTDEYRDLIEAVHEAQKEKDKYYDKYWEKYSECNKLEEKITNLEKLSDKLAELSLFVNSDDTIKTKYKLWKLEREEEEEEDE